MDWVLGSTGGTLDVIELRGIAAYGYHGVEPEERRNGQAFRADLRLHLDTRAASEADDLALTVDYARMARAVVDVLAGPAMNLLETVAERIAKVVLENEAVEVVEVTVHKPNAALGVQTADVSVHVRRAVHSWRETTFVAPDSAIFEAVGEAERRAGLVSPVYGQEGGASPAAPNDSAGVNAPGGPSAVSESAAGAPGAHAKGADAASVPARDGEGATRGSGGSGERPLRRRRSGVGTDPAASIDQVPDEPVDAIIGLGANLGEALATLRMALADMREEPGIEVVAVSPLARTAPVGHEDQPDFFNAVAHVRTTLSPRALLRTLQGIEETHGRRRSVRWGPRTLDLDLIAYDTLLADEDELTLPHPRAHQRSFVLVPWSLMAPGAFLPGLGGGPVAELAEAAPDTGCIRWLAPDWDRSGRDQGPRPVVPQTAEPLLDQSESADQSPGYSVPRLPEPLPTPTRAAYPAAGPGVPGFFAEARRGHSAFRGIGQDELEPPLKAVPYDPLPTATPGGRELPGAQFEPRMESGPHGRPMPYRHPPTLVGLESGLVGDPEAAEESAASALGPEAALPAPLATERPVAEPLGAPVADQPVPGHHDQAASDNFAVPAPGAPVPWETPSEPGGQFEYLPPPQAQFAPAAPADFFATPVPAFAQSPVDSLSQPQFAPGLPASPFAPPLAPVAAPEVEPQSAGPAPVPSPLAPAPAVPNQAAYWVTPAAAEV
ncbi:MAG: 2-amino-4-hydroxy-6-hydroxymethyldihydropteridine diphosphokinase [Bifidobacteriaceae bacterium]|jgi:dihydroneopterin aldolase/2-amino-4-hydroxy-6-hydroxymethyldihydropteridine diphosphokinase|nr:2-amino-4-hydroxy-6-hydroxymethyldihydropteridine diphosphokinase [Bifidobacteriaceae bacterium]